MSHRVFRAWLVAFTVCLSAVLVGSCRFPTVRVLDASQMPGFTLIREGETVWPRSDGSWQKASWQEWRDDATGVTFKVKWAVFVSSDQARRACEAELKQISIVLPMGTYSGQPLGDCCWASPMRYGRSGCLVFCFGKCAASALGWVTDRASEEPFDYMLLESVARRLLANLPGGRHPEVSVPAWPPLSAFKNRLNLRPEFAAPSMDFEAGQEGSYADCIRHHDSQ